MKLSVFNLRTYELFDDHYCENVGIPYYLKLFIIYQTPQVYLFRSVDKRFFVLSLCDLSKSDLFYLQSKTKGGDC